MKQSTQFDRRPLIIALAGPNGAGKTTFYHAHLASAGLRFIDTDALANELNLDPYKAATVADALRRELMARQESFGFETVFSDPAGSKLRFLKDAVSAGYTVVLCYIGLASAGMSDDRVAMRVSQGGHDVPVEKLKARYPRTLANLRNAIRELPHVLVYDNSDLLIPFQMIAVFESSQAVFQLTPIPKWFAGAISRGKRRRS